MDKIKTHILRKLYDHTYIGRRHCSVSDMRQGLPSHERDMKVIENLTSPLTSSQIP